MELYLFVQEAVRLLLLQSIVSAGFFLFPSIYCIPLCLPMDHQSYKGYDNCFVSSQAFTHLGCSYKLHIIQPYFYRTPKN